MKPYLAQLQTDLQNHLLNGETSIVSSVVGKGLGAESRLQIYKNAYQLRLIDALSSNYSCFHSYLGDEVFEAIALAYLARYPSTYRSIRWFGDKLPDFLKETSSTEEAYLAELAEFDWKITLAFDALDTRPIQIEDIAAIPPESWADMTMNLSPSVQCMQCFSNVVEIWEAIINEAESLPPVVSYPKAQVWIIWRENYENRFCQIPEDEAWGLAALDSGQNFGDVCEGLCQWHTEEAVGLRAASLLKGWVQAGLLTNLSSLKEE